MICHFRLRRDMRHPWGGLVVVSLVKQHPSLGGLRLLCFPPQRRRRQKRIKACFFLVCCAVRRDLNPGAGSSTETQADSV